MYLFFNNSSFKSSRDTNREPVAYKHNRLEDRDKVLQPDFNSQKEENRRIDIIIVEQIVGYQLVISSLGKKRIEY